MHTGILSACKSSTANARLNGHWKDTGDDTIDWTIYDVHTVECVLHYLYTGDYDVSRIGDTPTPVAQSLDERLAETDSKCNPDVNNTMCLYLHLGLAIAQELPRPQSPPPFEDVLPSGCLLLNINEHNRALTPIQDYIEEECWDLNGASQTSEKLQVGAAIQTHAKVYSFAHQQFFTDLAKLSLQRLICILADTKCDCTSLFPELADTIRHIYDTTPGPDLQLNPARRLLSQYVALKHTSLAGDDLDALAAEGGEFMVDVFKKVARQNEAHRMRIESLYDEQEGVLAELVATQAVCEERDVEIQKLRQDLKDWETHNKGLPGEYRKITGTSTPPGW